MIKTFLFVFISTLFCGEGGPFSLIIKYKEGEESKYKSDMMVTFSISLGETMSGTAMTIIERYEGEKDGCTNCSGSQLFFIFYSFSPIHLAQWLQSLQHRAVNGGIDIRR